MIPKRSIITVFLSKAFNLRLAKSSQLHSVVKSHKSCKNKFPTLSGTELFDFHCSRFSGKEIFVITNVHNLKKKKTLWFTLQQGPLVNIDKIS